METAVIILLNINNNFFRRFGGCLCWWVTRNINFKWRI